MGSMGMKNYLLSFEGRIGRGGFWMFWLVYLAVFVVLVAMMGMSFASCSRSTPPVSRWSKRAR